MNAYGQKRAENKRKIQEDLDRLALNSTRIAERAGVTRQTVSATLNGHCHSPKVLEALRNAGVPEELLFDPRKIAFDPCRMRAEEGAA